MTPELFKLTIWFPNFAAVPNPVPPVVIISESNYMRLPELRSFRKQAKIEINRAPHHDVQKMNKNQDLLDG